ncbi:MAG: pyridoxamine 5'-phosphate oxidase family protein [Desulfosoma sp.]
MRRKQCEVMDSEAIRDLLESCTIGRLATTDRDGYPYVTPVNYVFRAGRIYVHSAPEGEKIDNIRRDDRVGFQVDIPLAYVDSRFRPCQGPCRLHQLYKSVVIRGRARLVEDVTQKTEALNALVAAHEKGHSVPEVTEDLPGVRACAVIEIIPEKISAKFDLWQYKSLEDRKALAAYLRQRNVSKDPETVLALESLEQPNK